MNGEHHLFDSRLELDCSNGFGDDLRGSRADDVHAQNLAMLRIGDDFDEAIVRIEDRRLRVADEGEFSDFYLVALLFRLRLSKANAGNLRLAIGATWNVRTVDGLGVLACNSRSNHESRHAADVRQLGQAGDDVTDRVNAWLGRLHPFIRDDEAAIGGNLHFVEAHVVSSRCAADCYEYLLHF